MPGRSVSIFSKVAPKPMDRNIFISKHRALMLCRRKMVRYVSIHPHKVLRPFNVLPQEYWVFRCIKLKLTQRGLAADLVVKKTRPQHGPLWWRWQLII